MIGVSDEDAYFSGMTMEEISAKRMEIGNKAIIAAVKTIAELSRATDLLAY